MNNLRARLGRIGAFALKEIREVARQPRLVVSLIVGPFLILGLFALGFRSSPPPLRTLLVMPAESELAARAPELEQTLEPYIEVVGVTQDADSATRRLLDREVDLVVVTPEDAIETIRAGGHAQIEVLHTQLDPFERAHIAVFSRASIDELNRTLLAEVARVSQERVSENDDALPAARAAAGALAESLRSGDDAAVPQAQIELDRALLILDRQLASSSQIHAGLDRGLGGQSDGPLGAFNALRDDAAAIDVSDPQAAEQAAAVEEQLAGLEEALADFTRIPPDVAVQPFVSEAQLATGIEIPLTTFYAPAVAVVLVQHLALTFAALSVVREHTLGSVELIRVGPTSVAEVVLGKYLGYSLIAGSITLILITALVTVFDVPMGGSWLWLAGLLGLLVVASLAAGFLVAAFAESDSQAVQYSMLTLLFTIFFSGFVLSLDRIAPAVRPVSFLVPATPGIASIHDVMFRGEPPRVLMVGILAAYAVVALGASTMLLGRRLRT